MLQPDTCSKNRSGILIKKKRDKLKKAAEHAKHKQKDMEAICLLPHIPSHDCVARECERVIINVSGQLFETQRSTLNRYPETLLGNEAKIKKFWDPRRKEYFLDRHRPSFQAILYYYQSGGRVRRPIEVHDDIFLEELQFYEIDEETITKYKKKEGFILEEDRVLPKKEWMKKLWLFCEEPESSGAARLFAIVTIISVFVSITDLQNNVTRLPRSAVKSLKAENTSLMPAKLLNQLNQNELIATMEAADKFIINLVLKTRFIVMLKCQVFSGKWRNSSYA